MMRKTFPGKTALLASLTTKNNDMKLECPKPGAIKNIPPPTCDMDKVVNLFKEGRKVPQFDKLTMLHFDRMQTKEQLVNTACVMVLEMSRPEGSPVSLSFWRAEVNRLQIELYGIEADIQRITGNV